jgi:hypothetical protein
MLDFLGVTENWSAIENVSWVQKWAFTDQVDGSAVSLDGVTFLGAVYVEGEDDPINLTIEKSDDADESNILIVGCQGLPEGRHKYEIYAISESGNKNRLVSGYIGVVSSVDVLTETSKEYYSRTLSVRLPGNATQHLRLEWMSCTIASLAADEARKYLLEVREKYEAIEADIAKLEAIDTIYNEILDIKNETAELTTQAQQSAQEAHDTAEEIKGYVDEAKEQAELAKYYAYDADHQGEKGEQGDTPFIGSNGNWWIGLAPNAVDTGVRATPIDGVDGQDGADGANGKSPIIRYVNEEIDGVTYTGNYWYVWQDGGTDYVFTGILAEGKNGMDGEDGIDGDKIVRKLVDTFDDLPDEEEKGVIYYVPRAGTDPVEYDVYCWLDQPGGIAGWTNVNTDFNDYSQFAFNDLSNVTTIASDSTVNYPDEYHPNLSYLNGTIASNSQNLISQLTSPATYDTFGMVKLSTVSKPGVLAGIIGMDENGRIQPFGATVSQNGVVKTSTSTVLDNNSAGCIGRNANGQIMAMAGNISLYGTAKYKNTKSVTQDAYVDTEANGALVVPMAGYRSYGVVCFGTAYDITINDAPYIITIPKCNGVATYNTYAGNLLNSLTVNLSQNGCIIYDNLGPNGDNDGNSLYIKFDKSLNIERHQLNVTRYDDIVFHDSYATSSRGGSFKVGFNLQIDSSGVLTVKTGDIGSNYPVTGATVATKLTEYPTRTELLSYDYANKTYVKEQDQAVLSTVNNTLNNYVTKTGLEAKNYATKSELNSAIATRVQCAGGVTKLRYMSEESYASLSTKDSETLYILY